MGGWEVGDGWNKRMVEESINGCRKLATTLVDCVFYPLGYFV